MKILFTADYHIYLRAAKVPQAWALNRFRLLFQKIESIECDLHIIGGDLFDKMPNLEELALVLEFLNNTRHPTVVFDGNHEASKKGETFLTKVESMVTNDNVSFILEEYRSEMYDIIPYNKLKQKSWLDPQSSICFTHVRGAIEPHVKPEIDLVKFEKWETVYAGDLHATTNSQLNLVYPGSPITTTFHRNKAKGSNGYIMVDTDTNEYVWHELHLPQLIRKTVSCEADMIPTEVDWTIYELDSDAKLDMVDNELLDKVIKYDAEDATLHMSGDINEELEEYLVEIQGLQGDELSEVIGEFNACNKSS